jgi:hypothetical protein
LPTQDVVFGQLHAFPKRQQRLLEPSARAGTTVNIVRPAAAAAAAVRERPVDCSYRSNRPSPDVQTQGPKVAEVHRRSSLLPSRRANWADKSRAFLE